MKNRIISNLHGRMIIAMQHHQLAQRYREEKEFILFHKKYAP